MSYTKPPEMPRDHPLALLIERSQKANKLPSCEGCNFWTMDVPLVSGDCFLPRSPDRPFSPQYEEEIITRPHHFCAAWEPKP